MLALSGCQSKPVASSRWPIHDCGPIPGVDMATYCFDQTDDETTDVLWFFHGLGDDAQVWRTPTSVPSSYPDLIKAMKKTKIVTISFAQPVTIAGLPFKSGWMMTGYPNRTLVPTQATLDVFKNKIVPFIEEKYGIKGPYKIAAHSQGGNNAAMVIAAFPEMWSRAVLLNPALITDAHDPWKLKLGEYCPWCYMVPHNYPDFATWRQGGPSPAKGAPHMLVTACPIDIFGLYSGAEAYVVKSRKLGNKVTFIEGPPICSHWSFSVSAVVKFLGEK
jgi:pimeloyl-ACP methyl ester carboxylesterase